MGKTCGGAEELDVDTKRRRMTAPDRTVIHEGEIISVHGSTAAPRTCSWASAASTSSG
jgi:pyruvate,orthophosphate dikinase